VNRLVATSEAHVDVARRPGDVPVLSWTNVADNNERQGHTEKPISPDLKNGEKNKLLI
jgi:3,4-dihydroxy-2-butanone 4-phosphate synthase